MMIVTCRYLYVSQGFSETELIRTNIAHFLFGLIGGGSGDDGNETAFW